MLEIGSIVDGKYKILNKIGQGGMSIVYLAMNERANKQWAIKEVRKDGVSNFEVVKQGLIAETDMLKNLSHPHLPSIIDVIDGEGTFLIVMDYIEGKSLASVLRNQGAQPEANVIEWSKQLCDVLGYLHTREKPIIYRDMKPANVMLKPNGDVTLIDFGTAREFKSANVEDTTCLGTQGYAAPEQFGGMGQTDARTDIYCLGATMYHLVTGHNPAKPPYEMYPIRHWNPSLSSGLEKIILKCTQKNPEDRYQSCAELMYALEHYQEDDEVIRREYKKKWRLFLGSAVMCGVCLIGTVGFKFASDNKKASTYHSYIEEARRAVNGKNYEEAWKNYEEAIELAPENGTAYLEALKDVIISDDNVFDENENAKLKQVYTSSNLKKLKGEDLKSYYQLCYNLGNYYYFFYINTEIGRNASGEYFTIIDEENPKTLTSQELTKAKALARICGYSNQLDSNEILPDGSRAMDFNNFWNDLNELVATDYDVDKDAMLALRVYEAYYQYVTRYKDRFYAADIDYGEMVEQLEKVKGMLEQLKDFDFGEANSDLDNDLKTLEYNISEMKKQINKNLVDDGLHSNEEDSDSER